jgi:hypothetical protein
VHYVANLHFSPPAPLYHSTTKRWRVPANLTGIWREYAEAKDRWRQYLASDAVSEWAGRARRSLKFCEIQINSVAGVQTDTDRAA